MKNRKVPDEVVQRIKDLRVRDGKSYREIAEIVGVKERVVNGICLGQIYKDVA